MRRLLLPLAVVLVPPLLACSGLVDPEALEAMAEGKPPPSPAWVGTWEGTGMHLVVTAEGFVEIEASAGGNVSTNTSVRAPAQSWDDGKLVVGLGMFTTTWKIDEAPYERDGEWRMVIEGVPVVRRTGPGADAAIEAPEDGPSDPAQGAPPPEPGEPNGAEAGEAVEPAAAPL